jgi:hypothetical protein
MSWNAPKLHKKDVPDVINCVCFVFRTSYRSRVLPKPAWYWLSSMEMDL